MTQDFDTRLTTAADKKATNSKDDFILGGKTAIGLLWHNVDEEPEAGRELLILNSKGIKVYPNPKNAHTSWQFFVRISRAQAWAVTDDILPEQEKEQI